MAGTVRPDEWLGDKWSHESIMDVQARMEPEAIKHIAEEWTGILDTLNALYTDFLEDVTATIDESWSGAGARAALNTMQAYVENSRVTLGRAASLSTGLDVLARATGELQQRIASPSARGPMDRMGVSLGWSTPVAEDLDLWELALNQVRTFYSVPAVQAGNAVSELIGPRERLRFGAGSDEVAPATLNPASDEQAVRAEEFLKRWGLGEPEPTARQAESQGSPGLSPQLPIAMTGMPGNRFPGKDFGSGPAVGAEVDELGEDDVYAGQNWMRDPLWRENPTRSAGFESATPTSRQPLNPDRMPPFGSVPTVTNAGGVGSGAAARPWGAMMPMMATYPPHASRRHGDENEHYSPQYLVNGDNTRELLGELPKGAAPVIGLWEGDADDDFGLRTRPGFRSR